MSGLIIYGDPHGDWRPLLRACQERRPDGVVILGDCDLALPLRRQIKPIFDAGIRVRWIPGNHDTDTVDWHDRLFEDYPEGNLHGRWGQVGGLIVAGLGGVFEERVWYPRFEQNAPVHATRRDYLRRLSKTERWRGDLPLAMRDAIFPEAVQVLSGLRVDVLVTHEAPSTHRHGFLGIDRAAQLCRAGLIIHGHHHEAYEGATDGGIRVRGLGRAEVFRIDTEHLA